MTGSSGSSELTIFTGRFGSGKTETAICYALAQARALRERDRVTPGRRLALVDLDIVTPYFRTREATVALRDRGVEVIAPSVIGQHLDTPAITPQILGTLEQSDRPTVLDVGGDRQGARALGQFSAAIRRRDYRMHFVVNPFRPFTNTLDGLASSIEEIQASARLQVTSLVSNPNLMQETTAKQIRQGHSTIEGFAMQLGLPIAFVAIDSQWLGELGTSSFEQPLLVLERFFVQPWEGDQPMAVETSRASALAGSLATGVP